MPFQYTCEQCGSAFERFHRPKPAKPNKFCSPICRYLSQEFSFDVNFWPRVFVGDDCWLWNGPTDARDKYGVLKVRRNGRRHTIGAHRLALEQRLGRPLTPEEVACHTCDVPLCVRNDDTGVYIVGDTKYVRYGHLWLGTTASNQLDMSLKGRGRIGTANGSAKFTDTDIRLIRNRRAVGEQIKSIAASFAVQEETISSIILGRTYRNVH